ncbi:PREDICTED: leucine-rich repeat-containing protein 72, partial [Merops nubicus]|uniref:leucine-rich repeat-containing protein 72 n=1 Tax=Merops nubicus TaxID=57421 RepID=UPI0004F00052
RSQAAGPTEFLGKWPPVASTKCELCELLAASASQVPQAVEKQLKICGFKKNVDVLVLYLAGQGLRSIPSLSWFHRLRYLWINNNKIQDLTFLIKNYCLTELYLNNNELTDISGALKHLRALQILLLHNNQLNKLGKTVKELKGMISLQTLNLFHNPLAQDPDYRLYVINFLPSVQLLDRKRCEFGNHKKKAPFENPEDAVLLRAMKRSLMEFSCVDWNEVATCQERRLENKAEEPCEKLTIQFR